MHFRWDKHCKEDLQIERLMDCTIAVLDLPEKLLRYLNVRSATAVNFFLRRRKSLCAAYCFVPEFLPRAEIHRTSNNISLSRAVYLASLKEWLLGEFRQMERATP